VTRIRTFQYRYGYFKCHVIVVACRVSLLLNAGCETAAGTVAAVRQNDRAVLSPAKVRYNFMERGVFFK
jgi:hypothetical protein